MITFEEIRRELLTVDSFTMGALMASGNEAFSVIHEALILLMNDIEKDITNGNANNQSTKENP